MKVSTSLPREWDTAEVPPDQRLGQRRHNRCIGVQLGCQTVAKCPPKALTRISQLSTTSNFVVLSHNPLKNLAVDSRLQSSQIGSCYYGSV